MQEQMKIMTRCRLKRCSGSFGEKVNQARLSTTSQHEFLNDQHPIIHSSKWRSGAMTSRKTMKLIEDLVIQIYKCFRLTM